MTTTSAPAAGGMPRGAIRDHDRAAFATLNRWLMLPLLRSPLGRWVSSPVVGYLCVLTTTGRRSGRPRSVPLDYVVRDGAVYVLAGMGWQTDWVRNLQAQPLATLELPGRTLYVRAEVLDDPDEAAEPAVALARAAGWALVLEGLNPVTISDTELRDRLQGCPVVRLRQVGDAGASVPIAATQHDPGGKAWLLPHVVAPIALVAAWFGSRRGLRARHR